MMYVRIFEGLGTLGGKLILFWEKKVRDFEVCLFFFYRKIS